MSQDFEGRYVISRAITHADANTTVDAIVVPPKTLVPAFGVQAVITEVWAGGTPSHNVGDADDDDSWVDTTDITETTVGSYTGLAASGAAYSTTGKYYPNGGIIKCTVAASGSDGTTYIVAKFLDLSDFV